MAQLQSDGAGGGVQAFKQDMAAKQLPIRQATSDGDVRDLVPFGR